MTTQNERTLKENIQKNLIFYRKMRKITQKQLAEGINVPATTLSGWERGAATPDIDTLFAICNFLQVPFNDICGVISEKDNFSLNKEEQQLLADYQNLNDTGKTKLLERMDELIILGYTKKEETI